MATPQEIATASACMGACVPDVWGAILYELDQIRINGGGAAMTAQEIATASVCFGDCVPDKLGAMIMLLNEIVVNGGGGGGGGTGGVLCGTSDPVAAPAAGCTMFYRTDVVRVLAWNGSAWVVQFSEI